jgi:hypothetical protein
MGTFDVSIVTEPGGGSSFRSHVEVKFQPSAALLNLGHPCCKEIKAIQFVKSTYYHDTVPWNAAGNWHADGDNPFFPAATPWKSGRPFPLISTDDPGGYFWDETGFQQEFKLYAVCTAGKYKGKSFGYATWGHTIYWGFHLTKANPAQTEVTRWVEGVSKNGKANQNFGVTRNGLNPLPGGISW